MVYTWYPYIFKSQYFFYRSKKMSYSLLHTVPMPNLNLKFPFNNDSPTSIQFSSTSSLSNPHKPTLTPTAKIASSQPLTSLPPLLKSIEHSPHPFNHKHATQHRFTFIFPLPLPPKTRINTEHNFENYSSSLISTQITIRPNNANIVSLHYDLFVPHHIYTPLVASKGKNTKTRQRRILKIVRPRSVFNPTICHLPPLARLLPAYSPYPLHHTTAVLFILARSPNPIPFLIPRKPSPNWIVSF